MSEWASRRRGQPIAAIAVLIAAWIGGRALTWESPLPFPPAIATALPQLADAMLSRVPAAPGGSEERKASAAQAVKRVTVELAEAFLALSPSTATVAWPAASREHARVMAGHQLLWLAAASELPLPVEVAALLDRPAATRLASLREAAPLIVPPWPGDRAVSRWSLDAWALYRPGSSIERSAPANAASYGASQAGAVVRYRLAETEQAAALYLRGSRAFGRQRETELAVGLAAYPVAALPVTAHAEVRATRSGGRTALRPAAFAVTHVLPKELPLGLRAEAYVQAGYVAGRNATAFVDGQVRADRAVARFDLGSVRAGAGTWGGAQKGAARLDLGPTVALDLRMGDVPARLALDYRVRVAGQAEPGSGVAITLSTGF